MLLTVTFVAILLVSNFKYYESALVCDAENQHYSEMVSGCPRTCSNLHGPICHSILMRPSCVCNDGTVNDTVNNRCVTPENCPQIPVESEYYAELVCEAENEVFASSRSACGVTCQNRRVRRSCTAIIVEPSCVCKTGTIRDTVSGKCVDPNNCPV